MNGKFAVVYEKEVLRALSPLNLLEHTELEIRIVDTVYQEMTEADKAYQVLYESGLVQSSSITHIAPIVEGELQ